MNHPASIEGIRIYQIDFGWAPVVEIRDRGEVVASGPVVMDRDPAPEGVVDFAMPWRGVVKQPGAGAGGADRAIELELWPDSRGLAALIQGGEPQAMLVPFDPIIRFTVWEGALTDLSTNRLDTTLLDEVSTGILGAGTLGRPRRRERARAGARPARARRSRSRSSGSTRCSR